MRATLYMRTLPIRGVPPRGSVQDKIATAMIRRERTARVAENEYTALILQLGLEIPQKIFDTWTNNMAMEIHQESYAPQTIQAQRSALASLTRAKRQEKVERKQIFNRLTKLDVKSESLRAATPQEREEFQRKLRRIRMQAQGK